MDPNMTQEEFEAKLDALVEQIAAIKKGAKVSDADKKRLQLIHDSAVELGHLCTDGDGKGGTDGEPTKAGARWSADDMKLVKNLHDTAVNLGAVCPNDSSASNSVAMKVAKRDDVAPKAGTDKYGKVEFADATNHKYPIDTAKHVKAAWSYINMPKNAKKYEAKDLATIKGKIIAAWKKLIDKDGPPEAAAKSESLQDTINDIRSDFYEAVRPAQLAPSATPLDIWCADVLDDSIIARVGDDSFQIGYSYNEESGEYEFDSQDKWQKVEQEWVPAKLEGELMVNFGSNVKAGSDGHLSGHLVTFGSENTPDDSPFKDFFTKDTEYGGKVDGMTVPLYFHHCIPIKAKRSKKVVRFTEKVGEGTLKMDDSGIMIDAILTNTKYADAISTNIKALGWSSGTAAHLVVREERKNGTHWIKRWPLGLDASLTPDPADKRNRAQVASIKSVADVELDLDEPEVETIGGEASPQASTASGDQSLLDKITQSLKGITQMDEKQKQAEELAKLILPALKTAMADEAKKAEDEKKRLEDEAKAFDEKVQAAVKAAMAGKRPGMPVNGGGTKTNPKADKDMVNLNLKTEPGDDDFKAFNWFLKTGDPMPIRTGEAFDQAVAAGDIMPGLKTTYNLLESTQYQGQEAVPTLVANKIIEKRDPISIVRKAGADVQQVTSNAIVIPIEKASPEKFVITTIDGNNTFDQTTVQPIDKASVTIYMFTKSVPIDLQLLADATFDVEAWVGRRFARAMALTENYYFMVGTGTSMPQGIVAGASAGITSAASSALAFADLTNVYHSLTSEYRDDVSWFMNGTVEGLVRGVTGNPAYFVGNGGYQGAVGNTGFPQGAGWFVAPSKVFNSADMDSYGTTKKPVVVGNVGAGYAITERAGFTVLRDPYTLANKGLVNILFYYRNSGAVVNTNALKLITMPSF